MVLNIAIFLHIMWKSHTDVFFKYNYKSVTLQSVSFIFFILKELICFVFYAIF